MKRTPILLRSIFALFVIVVFVWSMFPLKDSDFYETFLKIVKDPKDATVQKLVTDAKAKQKEDNFKYAYPSKAIEATANEMVDPEGKKLQLNSFIIPAVVKQRKLKTNSDVISLVRGNAAGAIRLGIDLHGGAEFMIQLKTDKEEAEKDFERFRDNAVETLRKRLEKQGFYECDISPAGGNLVSVRVPVSTDDEKASLEKLIIRSAKLDFRLAHTDSNRIVEQIAAARRAYNDAKKPISMEDFFEQVYQREHPEFADYDLLLENSDRDTRYVLVSKKIEMDGKEIKDAGVATDEYGQRSISLSFSNTGAEQFGKVTSANVGRLLAIVLDGQLYSAPQLKVPILDGRAQITGSFSEDDAKNVADALVSGSLPFTIEIASRSDIEPTVGTETIRKSIWSGIIGTILVMIFMMIYYRVAGLVANLSLIFNAMVMLGAIAAFDVTLTLPGIAGIILTLGMAVDANVLIYERIREEIRGGKSVANAIDIGFNRAFSAIFDSNLTTLFVALILFWQGSGTIKGFAITLSIGIFTTLFTAVFLTRIFFDLILRVAGARLKSLNMLAFLHNPHVDFIKLRKIAFPLSALLVIGSISLMVYQGREMLGIDFTGGSQLLVKYAPKDKGAKAIPTSEIEKYLKKQGYEAKASYKTVTSSASAADSGEKLLEIVVRDQGGKVSDELGQEIIRKMDAAYPQVVFAKQSQSTLGALIGKAFTLSATKALVLAMIGMILYMIIRFQFSYSIAANIALVHDVIVSMGIYLAFGGQLTLQVVASLLTLIGYSVNDTIVTFDRQRENLRLMPGSTYFEVVNTSVNQTLGRTILTSLSVVLILLAQLFFGGDGIKDFIAVMLIGCIVGCYSSVFISPVITAYWHRKEKTIREADETAPAENA